MSNLITTQSKSLLNSFKSLQISFVRSFPKPRRTELRNPVWFVKKERTKHDELLTRESQEFVTSQVHERFGPPVVKHGILTYERPTQSLVRTEDLPEAEWRPGLRRTGVIARKIGVYPLWLKNGKKISTTLLQVADNHVIKYIPPEKYKPAQPSRNKDMRKWGCLMVGALSTDPSVLTKEYANLFAESGVMPKAVLRRFLISPEAALPVGTPLTVNHYRVGDVVDVRGKTIDRGFQGVMKRWGFKGMPATHGQTKTHRRGGNIGGGGEKGRVWPGTKMPGHMGNRWRILKGLTIWRINTKYNVLWVSGQNVPGETNSLVYVFDTILPLRKPTEAPPFPSMVERDDPLVEDICHPDLHDWRQPTITFEQE